MVDPTHVDFVVKRKIHVPPPSPGSVEPAEPLEREVSPARMFWFGIGAGVVFACFVVLVWKMGFGDVFFSHIAPLVANERPGMIIIMILVSIIVVQNCFRRKRKQVVEPKPPQRLLDVMKIYPRGDDKPPAA